jgi:hypothetical protein
MGVITSSLQRVTATLSWVNARLPKAHKLYPADFAHPHEIDQLLTPTWHNEAGLLLGVSPFHHVYSVRSTPERRELGNILVDAPTRGGKGLLAIAQLLTWPHSSVILDIKGELYAATAAYLRQRGHKIRVVDPRGVQPASRDPLHRCTWKPTLSSGHHFKEEQLRWRRGVGRATPG